MTNSADHPPARGPRDRAGYRGQPQPPVDLSATSAGFDFLAYDVASSEGLSVRAPAGSYRAARSVEPPVPVGRQAAGEGYPRHGRAAVVGQVRGIQQPEQGSVLTFRVERYDDAGNRLRPVPVQLRAAGFDGSLGEGDEVRVTGRWKDGTLHTDRVHNLTTGASVIGRSIKKALLIFLGVVAITVTVFVVFVVRTNNAFLDERDKNQREFQQKVDQDQRDHQKQLDQQQRSYCEQVKQAGATPAGC